MFLYFLFIFFNCLFIFCFHLTDDKNIFTVSRVFFISAATPSSKNLKPIFNFQQAWFRWSYLQMKRRLIGLSSYPSWWACLYNHQFLGLILALTLKFYGKADRL